MIKRSNFKPEKFLRNPHWQSMWPTFIMRNKPSLVTKTERLELPDGDFIDLEWCTAPEDKPIIILLHGITGRISSPYIKYPVPTLIENGWCPVMMYYRGYSGSHNRHDVMTHAGRTNDFCQLVSTLKERYQERPICAIGFSQGANMLLKYLGEQGENSPLTCALAVSPPFQLRSIANRVRYGMSRFYQWYLLRDLRAFYRNKFEYRAKNFNLDGIESFRSFWQFDDQVTAKVNGFKGAVDYYRQASCAKYLPEITVPTLIIHSADDPIMTPDIIPAANEISRSTTLELSEYGGHLGFVEGSLFKPKFWLNERIPQYLQEYL